jgi:uncharacterized protein with von Willebrand factor type A (vWA) domain
MRTGRSPALATSSTRSSRPNARRWRRRDDDDARLDELDLDTMPSDPAGRFRALGQHDFSSPDAASAFEELADRLRKDLLDAHLRR